MYQNLRAEMARKGITIDSLASLLGVHRNTVSNKLEGDSEFSFSQAEKIREVFFPEYNDRYLFRRTEQEERTA